MKSTDIYILANTSTFAVRRVPQFGHMPTALSNIPDAASLTDPRTRRPEDWGYNPEEGYGMHYYSEAVEAYDKECQRLFFTHGYVRAGYHNGILEVESAGITNVLLRKILANLSPARPTRISITKVYVQEDGRITQRTRVFDNPF